MHLAFALENVRRCANVNAMSVTITLGKAGRLVVPKSIRMSLGLDEGTRLRLEIRGGKIEVSPEADDVRVIIKDGFPCISPSSKKREGNAVRAIQADRKLRSESILAHRSNR